MMDLRCVEREKKSPHHQFFVGSLPPHLRSLWCLIPFPYLAFPFVAVVALTMRCLDSPCLAWPFLAYALSCRGDNDLALPNLVSSLSSSLVPRLSSLLCSLSSLFSLLSSFFSIFSPLSFLFSLLSSLSLLS